MQILNTQQGTKEWHDGRRCVVTGSKAKAVMGTAEARRGLIAELIGEEATEQSKAPISSASMERGNAEEVFAIRAYEDRTGQKVDRVGMCLHAEHSWIGLSPDGLIKNAAGKYTKAVEVKSPDTKNAILYRIENMIPMEETGLLSAKGLPLSSAPFLGIPSEYKWQVVHYFTVNPDLETLDFIVYDARIINDKEKLYIVTVERKNEILQAAVAEETAALLKFRADWLAWREIVLPTEF